jgi:F-type H+-transporting ATPase subunit a
MLPLALELHQHWSGWLSPLALPVAKAIFGPGASEEEVEFVEVSLYAWVFVIPALTLLCVLGTSKLERVPSGLQNLLEAVVSGLNSFVKSIVGEAHYRDFVPYIGSVFIYIFALNLWGSVPGMQAATSTINQTLALALCTFFMTHYAGFGYAGKKYLMHFVGEPLWLGPLMVPIHLIGEAARPLSLTLRLFGNIGGDEKAVAIFISLGIATGAYIPLQLPLSALGLFTAFVQALIFALLSAVYIGGALPHEHHGHDEHGHGHDDHNHGHSHDHSHEPAHAH